MGKQFFKRFAILLLGIFCYSLVSAGTLDTLRIPSAAMHKTLSAVIVLPDAYQKNDQHFPVVYLLHGWSGSYKDWPAHIDLRPLADRYGFILVCPDGGYDSWYLDSPVDSTNRYETHIIKEVIPFVDARYRTVQKKTGRAITGLSMGGHGALYLALRHSQLFFAASSMSGGVDLTFWPQKWGKAKWLGPFQKFPDRWKRNSVVNMIRAFQKGHLAIMIDCGVDDFFINSNRTLHKKLINAKVPHDYVERPGKHSWAYWTNALEYHLLFFRKQLENAQ